MSVLASTRRHWGRWVFYAFCCVAAAWLVWAGRSIWFPVSIAVVIAMVLDPTVDRLENRGCSRAVATALVFLLFLSTVALFIVVVSPGISAQAVAISKDLSQLFPDGQPANLVPIVQRAVARLDANPMLKQAVMDAARQGTVGLSQALQRTSQLFLLWVPNLMWFIVVPVLAFYILNDFHLIYAKGILLVPKRHRPFAQTVVAEVSAVFGKYLRGLALLCLLLGAAIAVLMFALGSPYWQLFGLLGGILYAVPVIGPLCTLGLAVLVTLVTATPGKALIVGASLVLLTNGLFDQVVTPRVLGKQVGLHPILTILALLLGYQIWGITGMLVAVPVAASIQTIVLQLVPKLNVDFEMKPLEELHKVEDETRQVHLAAEAEAADEHVYLKGVIENVEPG